MARYRVHGASSQTGEETSIEVSADTRQDAESIANGRGLLVSGVEDLSSPRAAAAQTHDVAVTTRNTPALTLGIIATVLAVLSLLVGWIPLLGLLALPVAALAVLLGLFGLLLAATTRFRGAAMPALGIVLGTGAIALPIMMTAGTTAVLGESTRAVQEAIETAQTEQAEALRETNGEADDYARDFVALYDVEVGYMDSLLSGRVAGVRFKVRNDGDRLLSRVKLLFYFKDDAGRVIHEEDFLPVNANGISFTGDNKPLKPGYIWQMEEDRFYTVKNMPNEWAEGSYELEIAEIEFSE